MGKGGLLLVAFIILIALLLASSFIFTGGKEAKVVVGTIQGGISTLDLIKEEELKEAGISMDVRYFTKTLDLANAFARGDVDIAIIPAELVGKLKEQGEEVYIIAVDMFQNQAVVGLPDIEGIDDLKGRRIGVFIPTGTFSMFKSYLKELYGIEVEELNLVNSPPPQLLEAYSRGEVDAVVLWEPFVSKLIVEEGASMILSYEGMWKAWTGEDSYGVMIVWAANGKALEKPLGPLSEIRKKASKRWGSEWAKDTLSEKYMLSEEVTELMMSRVKIWGGDLTDDLKENIRKVWTLAWLGGYLEEDPSVIGEEVFLAP